MPDPGSGGGRPRANVRGRRFDRGRTAYDVHELRGVEPTHRALEDERHDRLAPVATVAGARGTGVRRPLGHSATGPVPHPWPNARRAPSSTVRCPGLRGSVGTVPVLPGQHPDGGSARQRITGSKWWGRHEGGHSAQAAQTCPGVPCLLRRPPTRRIESHHRCHPANRRSDRSCRLSGRYRLSATDDNLARFAQLDRDRGADGHSAQRRLHAIQTLSQLSYSPTVSCSIRAPECANGSLARPIRPSRRSGVWPQRSESACRQIDLRASHHL